MNSVKKLNLRGMVFAAALAAIYAVLTILPGISSFAFGPVQFRVSEVLTVLPVFTPWAVPGLTLGCLLSNILSPIGIPDMIFGPLATLFAALTAYLLRNKPRGIPLLMPAVFNGIIIGAMITVFYLEAGQVFWQALLLNMGSVALGETVICYLLGYPFSKYLDNNFKKLKL